MTKKARKNDGAAPAPVHCSTLASPKANGGAEDGRRRLDVTVSKPAEPSMREIGGSEYELWDSDLLHRTMLSMRPLSAPDGADLESHRAGVAALALRAFKVRDEVEGMLASAAIAMHAAAMECSRRAMLPGQPSDAASRLRRDAANSARTLIELTEAIDRRRGHGSQQRIVVERIQVAPGAQAVVGALAAGTVSALPPAGQGAPLVSALDAERVPAGEGEGP